MAGTVRTQKTQVLAQIKKDVTAAVLASAQRIQACTRQNILNHEGAPGQALGSGADEIDLADSAYISTAKNDGYETGKAGMAGSRDARRGLYADKAEVSQGPNEFKAVVAFAAGRAYMMHMGYYDPRGNDGKGRFMAGTRFLEDCAKKEWPRFKREMETAATALQNVHVPEPEPQKDMAWFDSLSAAEQQAVQEASFMEQHAAAAERETQEAMKSAWSGFVASFGADQLKRERAGKTGRLRRETFRGIDKKLHYTGQMIQTNRWETAGERLQRISDAFESFLRTGELGHTGGMSYDSGGGNIESFVRRQLNMRA